MAPDADHGPQPGSTGPANGWWKEFLEVIPEGYQDLVFAEEDATGITHFQPTVIPGLLQTEQYASAITVATTLKELTEAEAIRLVQVRMLRQRSAFDPARRKRLVFLMDERTLHRQVGSVQTMREQLNHLRAMCTRPNVTVGVLPLDAEPHPGLLGPFILLDYDAGMDGVLCFEWQLGNLLKRDAEMLRQYHGLASDLLARATDPDSTISLIDSALRQLSAVPSALATREGRGAVGGERPPPTAHQANEPTDGGPG